MGQHRELADQVDQTITSFEHLISNTTPASIEALSKARVTLVQIVNTYIAHLGAVVSQVGDNANLLRWKEAHTHVVNLRSQYSAHIGLYTSANIPASWPDYRNGCITLMTAMRAHLREVMSWEPID